MVTSASCVQRAVDNSRHEPNKPTIKEQPMNEQLPPDPVTTLAAAAHEVRELFESFTQAGFTEGQALFLVAEIVTKGASK